MYLARYLRYMCVCESRIYCNRVKTLIRAIGSSPLAHPSKCPRTSQPLGMPPAVPEVPVFPHPHLTQGCGSPFRGTLLTVNGNVVVANLSDLGRLNGAPVIDLADIIPEYHIAKGEERKDGHWYQDVAISGEGALRNIFCLLRIKNNV